MGLSNKRPSKGEEVRKKLMDDITDSKEKMIRLSIDLPKSLRKGLKIKSAEEGRTEAAIVRELLWDYINQ